MRITFGIVYYKNSSEEILCLIDSIKRNAEYLLESDSSFTFKILLYDNSCEDPTFFSQFLADQSLNIKILQEGQNLGFGRGHNRLMKTAFSEQIDAYIALNPDGFLHYKAISELWLLSKAHNHCALIEARQVPIEHAKAYDPLTLETEWCSGACLYITYEIYKLTQGFDENIFMYCEDVDLSWQVQASGRKTLISPDAWFYHDFSQRASDSKFIQREKLIAARYLAYKWGNYWTGLNCERKLRMRKLIPFFSKLPPRPQKIGRKNILRKQRLNFSDVRW